MLVIHLGEEFDYSGTKTQFDRLLKSNGNKEIELCRCRDGKTISARIGEVWPRRDLKTTPNNN